jgi:hypothetical protein
MVAAEKEGITVAAATTRTMVAVNSTTAKDLINPLSYYSKRLIKTINLFILQGLQQAVFSFTLCLNYSN